MGHTLLLVGNVPIGIACAWLNVVIHVRELMQGGTWPVHMAISWLLVGYVTS